MVAFPETMTAAMRDSFDSDVLLLGAISPEEASWISELYEGDIDLVVLSKKCLLSDDVARARDRMRVRRPHVDFLETNFGTEISTIELLKLTENVKKSLQGKVVAAVRSAKAISS